MAKERKNNAKVKTGIILMALGLLFVTAAGGLFAYNRTIDKKAGDTARRIIATVERAPKDETYTEDESGKKTVTVDGEKYIGVISVPSLGINLPVQSDWSLAKLRYSPCLYSGSVYDGTAIICAHNYQSHFGSLKYASVGEKVYYTDVAGLTYTYKISSVEQIDGYDIEGMKTNGGWDMTLFTCTYSGRQRVTVRLIRTESEANSE
ncbi:MAG: sortase [Clostridia bacterium]|nr:sortase [Clostridia bacterium]